MSGPQKRLRLVIFKSPNGRDNWAPVEPVLVPPFVMHPDNMGRLVNGEMCMDVAAGPTGSDWYRAEKVKKARRG